MVATSHRGYWTPWNARLLEASLWMTTCLLEGQGFTCSFPQPPPLVGQKEIAARPEINRHVAPAAKCPSQALSPLTLSARSQAWLLPSPTNCASPPVYEHHTHADPLGRALPLGSGRSQCSHR
jgi:hypothetical protein